MNARKFLNVRVGLTVTALALSGALAFSVSCAGSGGSGGSGGNSNPGGSSGGGSAGTSTTPSGGSSGSCSAGADSVCFATGKASGAMSGYGWIALGKLDSASSPTCGGTAITSTAPCTTSTTWSSDSALCISGSIPAVVGANYTDNWGLQIGVNSIDPPATSAGSGTIKTKYKSITFNTTGSVTPTGAAIRGEIHRVQDPAGTTYCANMTSGTAISLTSFNTACWDNSGTSLTADDVTSIDKIGVQISSDINNAYTVTNFCLTGVTFGN